MKRASALGCLLVGLVLLPHRAHSEPDGTVTPPNVIVSPNSRTTDCKPDGDNCEWAPTVILTPGPYRAQDVTGSGKLFPISLPPYTYTNAGSCVRAGHYWDPHGGQCLAREAPSAANGFSSATEQECRGKELRGRAYWNADERACKPMPDWEAVEAADAKKERALQDKLPVTRADAQRIAKALERIAAALEKRP